jgi:large subunit ribosomal protein L18
MKKKVKKIYLHQKKRVLKKIVGTITQPRLSIFRSHKHIYAQLIDDQMGHTIAYSSTLNKTISTATKEASKLVGINIGEQALKKHVTKIVFDRGCRPYHGRIANLADGAREAGLQF